MKATQSTKQCFTRYCIETVRIRNPRNGIDNKNLVVNRVGNNKSPVFGNKCLIVMVIFDS